MPLPRHLRAVFDPSRLEGVARLKIMGTQPDPFLDRIVESAAKACHTPLAYLTFLDNSRQWIKASFGGATGETTLDMAICAATLEGDGTFVVPDCSVDPRVNWCPAVYGTPPVAFYAGSVLRDLLGNRVGSLCVVDTVPHPEGISLVQEFSLKNLATRAMAFLEGRLDG